VEILFNLDGIPDMAKHLDTIAQVVAGPIAAEALEAGGEVIALQARANIHDVTGGLSSDVIVVTRAKGDKERYVLIGPGFHHEKPDPGIYGLFVEKGHVAPGAHAASQRAKRSGRQIEFGTHDTPPHPWLGPAFNDSKDEAMEVVGEVIRERLEDLKI
jgi:HK97 gp10 family phage protein